MRVSWATNEMRHLERCKFLCEHSSMRQILLSVDCITLCVPNCCCRNLLHSHVKQFPTFGYL
ncbi:hypothetical protein OIU79_024667 [Salix purpurea]|uniref:Uncharacterized protein n=1 Tax=Salix purpurea TaxID=77065 RepID=A0A9Q1A632_SALPP|nr:hypothetical protein OIU79_024667 [Salix purpurea]